MLVQVGVADLHMTVNDVCLCKAKEYVNQQAPVKGRMEWSNGILFLHTKEY